MNCRVVISTECCKSNCSKKQIDDDDVETMYGSEKEDEYEDEEIDKASVKTVVKFPDEWRP
jgi:hypothetical protein